MEKLLPNIAVRSYLSGEDSAARRQYLAMVRFYVDGWDAKRVAKEFGYTKSTVYTLARDLRCKLAASRGADPIFKELRPGPKGIDRTGTLAASVVAYRKQNMSVPDIKCALDAQGVHISERSIAVILEEEGFCRLPRRDSSERPAALNAALSIGALTAPKSVRLDKDAEPEEFFSQMPGVLCFLPIVRTLGIDKAIRNSAYPYTSTLGRTASVLSFLALKLSGFERYSADDAWCMDRGAGLFAGLNVLPKAAWYSSYSCAVTRGMNEAFLKELNRIWADAGLLSDTVNLDFTAIPYWGDIDGDGLENNWSGKRSKALQSIQAAIAQDPEAGIVCYGDTTVRHENQDEVVLEFLDFYCQDAKASERLKWLVFDCRFTTYEHLAKLDRRGVRFVTIQRKSKSLEARVETIPKKDWKDVRVERSNNKHRTITVADGVCILPKVGLKVRQVFIKSTARNKPATIITNDFDAPVAKIVRKYARRWLVEKEISEQIHFFHLNSNTSGIVVKVDFDLTMTILAHNLYRVLAQSIAGYSHKEAKAIFNSFINNAARIRIHNSSITVQLKRKRSMALLLEALREYGKPKYPWLGGKTVSFEAWSTT